MAAKLLEGKPIAEKIRAALIAEVSGLKAKHSRSPKLVAVQVGDSESSAVYVKNQKKAAEAIGIEYELRTLPATSTQPDVEKLIAGLNSDRSVSAIILQLPVPKTIDSKRLLASVSPYKDAEGMHPQNICRLLLGRCTIGPCTAMAVIELIESCGVKLYGKEAVVVGHSEIVGKPVAMMLLDRFATTTVCHIATGERGVLADHVKRAEVLVVAVGKAGVVKGDWIREGAIVVDVGINRVGEKIAGDVEFDSAAKKASYITPVPGGVGPLTTTMLMRNTVELFKAGL